MRWLVLILLLMGCQTPYEVSLRSPKTIDSSNTRGMLGYGFSHEYIMVFGWLEEDQSDAEQCESNFDMTMHTPDDITKFVGSWCSTETLMFTDVEDGMRYYSIAFMCNEKQKIGLLFFQQYHNPGFSEAFLVYKNRAAEYNCVYDVILRSDIMLLEGN